MALRCIRKHTHTLVHEEERRGNTKNMTQGPAKKT